MFELPDASIEEDMLPPTIEDVRRLMKEREIDYKSVTNPNWLAYFKLHHRIVNQYGKGRVFLSGDAAHIHSPLSGQGINTGIQDAYNLAWKIGLVLGGKSPDSLLLSYNEERRRVGEEVVGFTDFTTKMVGFHNPVLSALRNKIVGVISHLDAVQEKVLTTLSQIQINYRESPIVKERWYQPDAVEGFHGYSHDLAAGERFKCYVLTGLEGNGTRQLYELLRNPDHNLLLFTGADPEDMEFDELRAAYNAVHENFAGLMNVHVIVGSKGLPHDFEEMNSIWRDVESVMHKDFGAAKASIYLIGLDGYIGFRNQPASLSDLSEYLAYIFV